MARSILQYSYDSGGNLVIGATTNGVPLQILRQPVQQIVASGDIATFSVVVADTRGVTFQWKFNGSDIPGATGDSLLLTNVSAADEGQYSVVVMNSAGSVTSASAMLLLDFVVVINSAGRVKSVKDVLTSGVNSFIRLTVADWVPKRDLQYSWWGVVRAGRSPTKPAYRTESAKAFLLRPGQYDVYWQQDSDHPPLRLAPGVQVKEGELATQGNRI